MTGEGESVVTTQKGKRYYWLKLYDNFFDQAVIKFLRKMPEGDSIVLIYLELLLCSIHSGGWIRTDGLYETIEKDLTLVIDEDEMKIKLALAALEKAGLIDWGTGSFEVQMTKLPELVGFSSESAGAQRMRNLRQRKVLAEKSETGKASQCDTDVTPVLHQRDGDIDIDRDIEKDSEERGREKSTLPRTPRGRWRNVFLTDAEAEELSRDYPSCWEEYLEQLSSFMASEGKTYQNHAAVIRRWIERDNRKKAGEKRDYSAGEGESL